MHGNPIPRTSLLTEHESKIRRLRFGSSKPTPAPLNGEATKPIRNAKKKRKEVLSVRDRENLKETHRHITLKGEGGENVSAEKRKTEAAPQPQRRGAKRSYATRKEETRSHTILRHSLSSKDTQIAPGSAGEIGRAKKKRTRKNDSPVPKLSWRMTQTTSRHWAGGAGRMKYVRTIPNPAKNSENMPWATM